jgi:DNA-binding SARP family transcriptional activator/tetratricopeptide (TPR) repeat protein
MPPTLRVRLLGAFSVSLDGEPVEGLESARLQSLFAYLVLHRDTPHLRQQLAFLFWPDSSEAQARNNLRQTLHTLRQASPSLDGVLLADNRTLRWSPDASIHLDVAEFASELALAETAGRQNDPSVMLAALERAIVLYTGDLLPSCYDTWITTERETLQQRYLGALRQVIHFFDAQRRYAQAIGYARRLLAHDPLDEAAYRDLMRLLAAVGDRAGAARAYHECVAILQRELGMAPSQETQEAYTALMAEDAQLGRQSPVVNNTSSLIGRDREWEWMQDSWRRARASQPSFILVTGEAGIGKSRLTEEFLLAAQRQEVTTAKTRCYAAEGTLSLAPIADWLRGASLRPTLDDLDAIWLAEVARILPELLSDYPNLPPVEPMSGYGQRQRFFQALARAILNAPQPLLLLIDDLQWCDRETLEFLHFLLRSDLTARLLIVGTARIEELPDQHALRPLLLDLRATIGVTEIALPPLDAAETAMLASRLIDSDIEVDTAMRIYQETEGNPLFIVERMRAGLEHFAEREQGAESRSANHAAEGSGIPSKAQAVIASRLAQLSPPAREVVALAATIGRAFALDLLMRASGGDEETITAALDELWQRRIIREQDATSYDFTHDKLREVAYAEISAPQRRLLHRRIAHSLEAMRADDLDAVSSQIAAHYDRAGDAERAIPYFERAALVSQRVYANEDAIELLLRALALLDRLPGGAKRDKLELAILLKLGAIYRITRGWTAPELERLVDRTLALCDTVGDDTQRMNALFGQESLLVVQARLERAQMVAEELKALYERTHASPPPISRMMLGGARMHLGWLREAEDMFEQIIQARSPDADQPLEETPGWNFLAQGWNFEVHTRAWQAHALWLLGHPDRAVSRGREAIQIASEHGQQFNQAIASTYFAVLQQICAEPTTARAQAEAALALSIEYKALYYVLWSEILVRFAVAREQPTATNISQLRASITRFQASGARIRLPYYLSLLAQVYALAGSPDEALMTLDKALAESRANNEHWWDAELHRLRGELLLARGGDDEAVDLALLRAKEIAEAQEAKSLELRAAISLARHWRNHERDNDAQRLLSEVYAWFTEGFETSDLQAAQELLTELA